MIRVNPAISMHHPQQRVAKPRVLRHHPIDVFLSRASLSQHQAASNRSEDVRINQRMRQLESMIQTAPAYRAFREHPVGETTAIGTILGFGAGLMWTAFEGVPVFVPKLAAFFFPGSTLELYHLYLHSYVLFGGHGLLGILQGAGSISKLLKGLSHLSSVSSDFRRPSFERLLDGEHPVQPLAVEVKESLWFRDIASPTVNRKTDAGVRSACEKHNALLRSGLALVGEQIDYRVGIKSSGSAAEITEKLHRARGEVEYAVKLAEDAKAKAKAEAAAAKAAAHNSPFAEAVAA